MNNNEEIIGRKKRYRDEDRMFENLKYSDLVHLNQAADSNNVFLQRKVEEAERLFDQQAPPTPTTIRPPVHPTVLTSTPIPPSSNIKILYPSDTFSSSSDPFNLNHSGNSVQHNNNQNNQTNQKNQNHNVNGETTSMLFPIKSMEEHRLEFEKKKKSEAEKAASRKRKAADALYPEKKRMKVAVTGFFNKRLSKYYAEQYFASKEQFKTMLRGFVKSFMDRNFSRHRKDSVESLKKLCYKIVDDYFVRHKTDFVKK